MKNKTIAKMALISFFITLPSFVRENTLSTLAGIIYVVFVIWGAFRILSNKKHATKTDRLLALGFFASLLAIVPVFLLGLGQEAALSGALSMPIAIALFVFGIAISVRLYRLEDIPRT